MILLHTFLNQSIMNRIFTFLVLSVISLNLWSQTSVVVSTGASYVNDVYYSFTGGEVSSSPRSDWDIAFATDRYSISILANNGYGVEVYAYPNGNASAWATVDITDVASWNQLYNSTANIDEGAFVANAVPGDDFDYGWGRYNMNTHHIEGDSLFVIKTVAGTYKKFMVVAKNPNVGGNTWEIRYANIDGTDEQNVTITADNYLTKNYVHYSIDNNQIVDREPVSENWDLLFTKYYDYAIPYNVTGVLLNSMHVTAQEVDGVTSATYSAYDEALFEDSLAIIGSDWKSFNMSTYTYDIDADRVYFLKVMSNDDADSTYWKLTFTGFGGSSTGTYTFDQELNTTAIQELSEVAMFEAFPNPATEKLTLVFDTKERINVSLIDLSGKLVLTEELNEIGFTQKAIDIADLPKGAYTLILESDNAISRKVIIKQ
jgi:hypothetical protein